MQSNLAILNEPQPTYAPSNGHTSSPDISLASAHLAPDITWSTLTRLNSDHLPILIVLAGEESPTCTHCSYTNFHKANWEGFTEESEFKFRNLPVPTIASQSVSIFNKILIRAAKHHIPSGYRKVFTPGLPREAHDLLTHRDAIRAADHSDPRLVDLNNNINQTISEHKRRTWLDNLARYDHRTNTRHFWRTLRGLSGKSARPPPNSFGIYRSTNFFW